MATATTASSFAVIRSSSGFFFSSSSRRHSSNRRSSSRRCRTYHSLKSGTLQWSTTERGRHFNFRPAKVNEERRDPKSEQCLATVSSSVCEQRMKEGANYEWHSPPGKKRHTHRTPTEKRCVARRKRKERNMCRKILSRSVTSKDYHHHHHRQKKNLRYAAAASAEKKKK